jgi:hypothetical protein
MTSFIAPRARGRCWRSGSEVSGMRGLADLPLPCALSHAPPYDAGGGVMANTPDVDREVLVQLQAPVPKSWTWGRSYARFLRVIRIGR